MVLPQNELSDHCKIITELALASTVRPKPTDKHNWNNLESHYIWSENDSSKFRHSLENSRIDLEDIKQRLDAGLIESTGLKLQGIYQKSADLVLKKTKLKKPRRFKSEKWFNSNCSELKREARKIGRQKHYDPTNLFLREKYKEKLNTVVWEWNQD